MKKFTLALYVGCALSLNSIVAFADALASSQTANVQDQNAQDQTEVEKLNSPVTQSVSTLGDALAAAYVNNASLLQARQDLMAKHQNIAIAKAEYFPKIRSAISMSASKLIGSGSSKDTSSSYPSKTNTSTRSGNVTLSQNLFAGGATMASVLSADQSIRGLWSDLLSNEQKTFLSVIKAYIDLINKLSKVDVYKTNHIAMKKNYETAFEKHSIGEEPLTQVANAESKLAGAEADLRTAEADVVGAKATLAALVGVDAANIKKPEEPSQLPQSLEQAISFAVENNPDVIKAQFDHRAAEADIDKVKGAFLPSIDLTAKTSRDEASSRSINASKYSPNLESSRGSNYQTNQQIQVEMSYELYAGGKYSAQKRQAHDTAVAKRIAIESVKSDLVGQVKSTFESYHAAKTNIENYKKQVKAAEVALEATRQEMQVGTKVLLDVLNAQTDLVKAKVGLIDAEKNYYQTAYQMVSLLGGLHAKAMKLSVNYFDPQKHFENISVGF